MSANLWSDATTNRSIRADGTYLSGKTAGYLISNVTGVARLTENQTIHMGASLKNANAGMLKPYVRYKDAAGNLNWVGYPAWTPTSQWQRFEATCVVPSGMTVDEVGLDSSGATSDIEVSNPVFSYGSPVCLASSAHTPYATQDHVAAEYATKAALKVTSDAVASAKSYTDTVAAGKAAVGHKHAMADVTGLQAALDAIAEGVYPVGSLYLNATDATNPHDLLGFGTWQQVAQGRCLIGADSKHGAGSGGGSMSRTLSTANLPSHTHTYPAVRSWAQNQKHHYGLVEQTSTQFVAFADNVMIADPNTSHQNSSNNQVSGTNVSKTNATGSGSAISVEPAWFGVYIWVRTA